MPAVLLASLPPSLAPSRLPSPLFTRKDVRRDGSSQTLARIDRNFVNLPMTELRDSQCHSHTVGTIGDKTMPRDHIPVRIAVECPKETNTVIWRWLTQHPLFINMTGRSKSSGETGHTRQREHKTESPPEGQGNTQAGQGPHAGGQGDGTGSSNTSLFFLDDETDSVNSSSLFFSRIIQQLNERKRARPKTPRNTATPSICIPRWRPP